MRNLTSVMFLVLVLAVILMSGCKTTAPEGTPPNAPPAPGVPAETGKKAEAPTGPVLVIFSKPDCPACLKLAPTIAALENEYTGKVTFRDINTDVAKELVFEYLIEATPTVLIFVDGKEKTRLVNPREPALREALDAVIPAKG